MPVPAAHRRGARGPPPAGEEGGAPLHRRIRLPLSGVEHLEHFVSRRAFDIEGLGEKQIELFLRKGLGQGAGRYLRAGQAQQGKIRLEDVEGFGETSVRNLFAAIEARRDIALDRFIYALGIRHVGETTAVALARGYGSWDASRRRA